MSEQVESTSTPAQEQPTTPLPNEHAEIPAPPVFSAEEPKPSSPEGSLSTFMKVSIGVLSVVTVLSISLLFIGDFEGRFERVFSTLALFTVFVLLTMFDTRREKRGDWYASIALIANTYILGLLLIVIWVTPYDPFTLQFTIMWQSVYVIVVTRIVVWCLELLFRRSETGQAALSTWSQVTGVLALLTLVLFTAPLAIEAFQINVPDLYWKFSVASLILTGLGIAVTLLLSWYFRSQEKQNAPAPAPVPTAAPVAAPVPAPAPVSAPPAPQQELLPWPTFADGTPLPMKADGQPDFSVLQQPR